MSDTETKVAALPTYEERVKHVSIISKPLASKKQTKRSYKLIKKATKARAIKRGVKEVVKAIRKGEKGVCIIAGDISPIEVDLGASALSKRPTSCILITPNKPTFTMKDAYDELFADVKAGQITY